MQFPKYVAFKGSNNNYLSAQNDGFKSLIFSSTDIHDETVVHEIMPKPDGSIWIRSLYHKDFWAYRTGDKYVTADATLNDSLKAFFPVEFDKNIIGLRSRAANNSFCRNFSNDNKLIADCPTMGVETQLTVIDLVSSRAIQQVIFRIGETRYYNEITKEIESQEVTNRSTTVKTEVVRFQYTDTTSTTWNAVSSPFKFDTQASITTGTPTIIADKRIILSSEAPFTIVWGKTVPTQVRQECEMKAQVKPNHKMKVTLLMSTSSCDVPFTYTQQDILPKGEKLNSTFTDGSFTGENCYKLILKAEQIPL